MKLFLKKIFWFITPLVSTCLILLAIANPYISDKSSKFKIADSKEILIIGDSHIQKSLSDEIISNSKNVSIPSESFYFTYYKLKAILDANHSIKTVILGTGNHNISAYYEDFIIGRYSMSTSPKYFFLLPFDQKVKLISYNFNSLPPFLRSISKIAKQTALHNEHAYADGYKNRYKSTSYDFNKTSQRLKQQYLLNDSSYQKLSSLCIEYLEKIITLCNEKNIRLIAINTPTHKYYRNNTPEKFKNALDSIIHLNNLEYLDFSSIDLPDNHYIPDGDHVSSQGAVKTSTLVQEYLTKKGPVK